MKRSTIINSALVAAVIIPGTILAMMQMPEAKSSKMVQKQVAVVESHGFFTSTSECKGNVNNGLSSSQFNKILEDGGKIVAVAGKWKTGQGALIQGVTCSGTKYIIEAPESVLVSVTDTRRQSSFESGSAESILEGYMNNSMGR